MIRYRRQGFVVLAASACLFSLCGLAAAQDAPDSLTVGRRLQVTSKILNETRDVWVALPAKGQDAVASYYGALGEKFGYPIPVTEKTLAGRAFQLIRGQRFEDAAALLRLNARAYPDSAAALQNLAFLYERMKDWKQAAAWYEKAAEKAVSSQPELAKFCRAQAERLKKRG